jgi:hypothetical protein
MGYRSNVSIVFYTRKYKVVPFAALKLWFDENYPVKEAMTEWEAKVETGDDWIMVTYKGVKWYDDVTHVVAVDKAVETFVETFDAEDEDDVAYEFIRIGEEPDDIEDRHTAYCDWRLSVRREIIFD